MNGEDRCAVLIGLLLSALLASPWMVYVMRERDRRKQYQKRRRRRPKKRPGPGVILPGRVRLGHSKYSAEAVSSSRASLIAIQNAGGKPSPFGSRPGESNAVTNSLSIVQTEQNCLCIRERRCV